MSKKTGLILITLLFFTWANQLTLDLPVFSTDIKTVAGVATFSGDVGAAAGAPALPFIRMKALLPPTADIGSVTIAVEGAKFKTQVGKYKVAPAPPTMIMNRQIIPEGVTLTDGKNLAIYNSNTAVPTTPISNITAGEYRSYKTVTFLVSPFRYNPVSQELEYLNDGKIVIRFSSTRNRALSEPSFAEQKIKEDCINSDDQLPLYPQVSRAGSMYLIITTNNIKSQILSLDNFIETKKGKGFEVKTITESDYGSGPDNLRSWLQDNYQSLNIEYALLIGTPNPQGGAIPMKVMYPMTLSEIGKEEYRDVPSDQYFAELTGNWDLNGNGIFGEGADCGNGGALSDVEIKIGRIPFSQPETIDEILDKSIAYETADEGSIGWRKSMFQSVVKYDDQTSGDPMMDGIKALSSAWSTKKFSQGQCSESAVTNEWNSGNYGYKLWLTHGLWNMAQHIINSSYAKTLKKDSPCFVVMGSCLNARPRDGNLSATILSTAGIGCLAATQVSLYRPGEIFKENQWYNQALMYHFSKMLIVEELPIGDIVAKMQSDLSIDYPGANYNWWHNWPNFTIYGDPALGISSCGAIANDTIAVTKPTKDSECQQGTEQKISWETNCSDDIQLSLMLYKGSSKKADIATVQASESPYNWIVPASADAGSGYTIRIAKSTDSEIYGESDSFIITEADNTEYTLTIEGGSGSGTYKAGTTIEIKADAPEEGKIFDLWTGTGISAVKSKNSATTEVTMPAKDITLTASYMKKPPSSGNLVILNLWESESCDLSESSFDSSKVKSDTLVTMSMTIGEAPNDTTYPWCKISTYLDGNFAKVKSIKVFYKSETKHLIELPQKELAEGGASYTTELAKSSSWKEITIPIDEDNFSQPSWVDANSSLKKDLILSDLMGLSIVSTAPQGSEATIQFKEITILGYEPKENVLSVNQKANQLQAHVQNQMLFLSIPQKETYAISFFTLQGKVLHKIEKELQSGLHSIPLQQLALSQQIILCKVVASNGRSLITRYVLK